MSHRRRFVAETLALVAAPVVAATAGLSAAIVVAVGAATLAAVALVELRAHRRDPPAPLTRRAQTWQRAGVGLWAVAVLLLAANAIVTDGTGISPFWLGWLVLWLAGTVLLVRGRRLDRRERAAGVAGRANR